MNNYIVDGRKIRDVESLCDEFANAVNAPEGYFGKCLESFDDCLFGGFGLESPCTVTWKDSSESKKHMGSQMLAEYCEKILSDCPYIHEERFEEGKEWCLETLKKARSGEKDFYDLVIEKITSVSERSCFGHKVDLILE